MKLKIENLKLGMRFISNVNGRQFMVVGLQPRAVILLDEDSNRELFYDEEAFKRLDVTLLEEGE